MTNAVKLFLPLKLKSLSVDKRYIPQNQFGVDLVFFVAESFFVRYSERGHKMKRQMIDR